MWKKWTDLVHASYDENCNNFVQCYKTVNLKLKRQADQDCYPVVYFLGIIVIIYL